MVLKSNDERYQSAADLPKTLPMFPLPGALLLPGGDLPLNIFEPRYLEMVSTALSGNRLIGMIQPRNMETERELDPAGSVPDTELYEVGCAGRITSFLEVENNQVQIILTGICRFKISEEVESQSPFRVVRPDYDEFLVDLTDENETIGEDREKLLASLRRFLDARSMQADWDEIREVSTSTLINTLSMIGSFTAGEKQALLEAPNLKQRTRTLMALADMSTGPDGGERVVQ